MTGLVDRLWPIGSMVLGAVGLVTSGIVAAVSTDVQVAVITALAAVIVATVPAWLSTRRTLDQVSQSVGAPDGDGSVQEQAAGMRSELHLIRTTLDSINQVNDAQSEWFATQKAAVQELREGLADHEDRLTGLEAWRDQWGPRISGANLPTQED